MPYLSRRPEPQAAFIIDDQGNPSKLINSHTSQDLPEVMFLDKEEEVSLPFKHVKRDKTERSFKGKVLKSTPDYKLVKPDRALLVQLIRFAPDKGPKDYVGFYKYLDTELQKKYGKTRCEMDVHEITTFLTLGTYDMIVLWDAPDSETFHRVVTAQVNPGSGFGSSETHPVVCSMTH